LTGNSNVGLDGRYLFAARDGLVDAALIPVPDLTVIQDGEENGTPEEANNTTVAVEFTDGDPNAVTSQFTGVSTIDCGDNSTPTPVNVGDIRLVAKDSMSTTWLVNGAHTYLEGGQYAITVHVVDRGGSTADIFAGLAHVKDAPLLVDSQVVAVQAMEGGDPFDGELLTFTDADTGTPPPGPGDFTVKVDWGDGDVETLSASSITQPGGPGTEFHVAGHHRFQFAGFGTIRVTITDEKVHGPVKQSVTTDIPSQVGDAPATLDVVNVDASLGVTAGRPFT